MTKAPAAARKRRLSTTEEASSLHVLHCRQLDPLLPTLGGTTGARVQTQRCQLTPQTATSGTSMYAVLPTAWKEMSVSASPPRRTVSASGTPCGGAKQQNGRSGSNRWS